MKSKICDVSVRLFSVCFIPKSFLADDVAYNDSITNNTREYKLETFT